MSTETGKTHTVLFQGPIYSTASIAVLTRCSFSHTAPASPSATRQANVAATASLSSSRTEAAPSSSTQDRVQLAYRTSPSGKGRSSVASIAGKSTPKPSSSVAPFSKSPPLIQPPQSPLYRRRRVNSLGQQSMDSDGKSMSSPLSPSGRKLVDDSAARAKARNAQKINDAMVYLDGPQVYTCAQCRTHLTSHDDIISKSFHGRHGRAYLFDQCVNVTIGPSEERRLMTGLHAVCDIFCKRCKNLVGWTYLRAYEASQKYKEGKFIIEKINLYLEESDCYDVAPPAGERADRWRRRSMSWGSESSLPTSPGASSMVYEYQPSLSSLDRSSQGGL